MISSDFLGWSFATHPSVTPTPSNSVLAPCRATSSSVASDVTASNLSNGCWSWATHSKRSHFWSFPSGDFLHFAIWISIWWFYTLLFFDIFHYKGNILRGKSSRRVDNWTWRRCPFDVYGRLAFCNGFHVFLSSLRLNSSGFIVFLCTGHQIWTFHPQKST